MTDEEITAAIKRADVYQYFDWEAQTLHLASRNRKAPLTPEEKSEIRQAYYRSTTGTAAPFIDSYKLVFDN